MPQVISETAAGIKEGVKTALPFNENHWLKLVKKGGIVSYHKFKHEHHDDRAFDRWCKKNNVIAIYKSEIDLIEDHHEVLEWINKTLYASVNAIKDEIQGMDKITKENIKLRSAKNPKIRGKGEELRKKLYKKVIEEAKKIQNNAQVLIREAGELANAVSK